MSTRPGRIASGILGIVLTVSCGGCATANLWAGKPGLKTLDVFPGTASQLFLSYEKVPEGGPFQSVRSYPAYCIPYRLETEGHRDLGAFGEKEKTGILLIRETKSFYLQKDIESLMEKRFERFFRYPVDVHFLYLMLIEDGSAEYIYLPFSVTDPSFSIPRDDFFAVTSRIKTLSRVPPIEGYRIVPSRYDNAVTDPSAYYADLCCHQATYEIRHDPDCSGWAPLLPSGKAPMGIRIFVMSRETVYDHSLFLRLVGTPFAVAADLVTSPIQLVMVATVPYWMPK